MDSPSPRTRPAHETCTDHLPQNATGPGDSFLRALTAGPTSANLDDLLAQADAKDGGLGLLRRESDASAAREVGRYGGDCDAHHEQPETSGRGGCCSWANRTIAPRHHRS